MLLWVGLGNPGARYAGNRHNIGFMALDRIAADHGFGPWKAAHQGLVSEGRPGGIRVTLLKPQTFMNLSGQAVRAAVDWLKLTEGDVTVWHDELDLAPGRLRLKTGGGHAGHNGLRSIHAHLGEGYHRVRLGIGHPGHKDLVATYVLNDFAKGDRDWLVPLMDGIGAGAALLATGDSAGFQNAVALKVAPPRPASGRQGTVSTTAPATAPATPPTTAPTTNPATNPTTNPAVPPPATEGDPRSPLQRLRDRFR